jgi:hypothetical protein
MTPMEDMNPYAAPQSDLPFKALADKSRSVWRDGDLLVMREKAALPNRCIECNAPQTRPLNLRLDYAGPTRSFVLSNPLHARTFRINVPICERHRGQRRARIARALCLRLLALALAIPVLYYFVFQAGSVRLVFLLVALVAFARVFWDSPHWAPPVEPRKIDGELIWLSGADPAYLAQLPPFPD